MPSKTQSVIIGGLVVGLLGTSVFSLINFLCCLGVIIGAMVAVWHYTTTYKLTIPAGQGALIGALAGIVGAVIASVLNYILVLAGLNFTSDLVIGAFEGIVEPEDMYVIQQQVAEQSRSITSFLVNTVLKVLTYSIFGAAGGAIGASVFEHGGNAPGNASGSDGGGGGPRVPRSGSPRTGGPQQARQPQERGEPVTAAGSSASPARSS